MKNEKERILLNFDADIQDLTPKLKEVKELLLDIETLSEKLGINITVTNKIK